MSDSFTSPHDKAMNSNSHRVSLVCQFPQVARDMASKTLQINSNLDAGNVAVPTVFSDKVT